MSTYNLKSREARTFIDKQMECNIGSSSSVSMFKKERKLDDGKVVWDSVVKLRKKNPAQCTKFPQNHLGIRNNWIQEFSNILSGKASAYILESMCAERTSRQEVISQTLLNRFNNILEQEASLEEPKTLTHKAMVVMADKLSLWLDKNVKVSKKVVDSLRQMEEEEKKKRMVEEMERLEREKREREEEKKRKMAEEQAETEAEPKSAQAVMEPPAQPEPESEEPETDQDPGLTGLESGDDDKLQEKDSKTTGEGQQDDGQQALNQEPQSPPPPTDSTDGVGKTEGPSEYEKEFGNPQQIVEDLPEGEADETVTEEGKVDDTVMQEGKVDEIDGGKEKPDVADEHATKNVVPYDSTEKDNEGLDESVIGTVEPSSEDVTKIKPVEFLEPDTPDESLLRKVPSGGGAQNVRETLDTSYPTPDVDEMTLNTLGASNQNIAPSDILESPYGSSVPPSSDSEYSDRDEMNIEPSKDTATLVEELLGSATEDEDTVMVDHQGNLTEIQEDQGKSVDDKTNMVLNELAEMIASMREENSPLQEAIKDIMEKELEERLGDKDVGTINEVAGKVGTWMDKMVERVGKEYGERRSPSRVRHVSPRALSLPKDSSGPPPGPELVPQMSFLPAAVPQGPTPAAVPPEGFGWDKTVGTFETARSPSPLPPVSQKPKGPIFELRKVDTRNIFNVTGTTHTKAKRKIQEARGHPKRVSQESLDLDEWVEWAGLVSDVGQNWAKWIEGVAQGGKRPVHTNDKRIFYDAKEWKNMNKELQREGDVWMKKVTRKQSKKKIDKTPEAKPL